MTRRPSRALAATALGLLLVALCATAPGVAAQESGPAAARGAAQESGPAAAIAAYSAALNSHDLAAALALFDQNGSATDARGRHFEGRAGLTEFLLSSGFDNPEAQVVTEGMHVVANRAVWTYTCSCASGATEVRLVVNKDKITVFAVQPPPKVPAPPADAGARPWPLGRGPGPLRLPWVAPFGLAGCVVAVAMGLRRGRSPARSSRPHQGRLLAALAHARQRRNPAIN